MPVQISRGSCNYRGGFPILCSEVAGKQQTVIESPAAFEQLQKWGLCLGSGEDHLIVTFAKFPIFMVF